MLPGGVDLVGARRRGAHRHGGPHALGEPVAPLAVDRDGVDGVAHRGEGLHVVDQGVGGIALHQVPVPLWTAGGTDMTHNPAWIESTTNGLRAYFMPEDDRSTIYIYEVDTR